jgi:hypothetical protein
MLPSMRADERTLVALSPLAKMAGRAGRAGRPIAVSVAIPCVRRPPVRRRVLGPASIDPFLLIPRRALAGPTPHEKAPSDGRALCGTIRLARCGGNPLPANLVCARRQLPAATPSGRALALRGVEWSGASACSLLLSHFGLRLMPAEPVLIVGVSRRCRSVACVRADASPNEVYAPCARPQSERCAVPVYRALGRAGKSNEPLPQPLAPSGGPRLGREGSSHASRPGRPPHRQPPRARRR